MVTEIIFHGGETCFRQMSKNGVPGLHACLLDDVNASIHVDKHQVTTDLKLPTGMCVFSPAALPEHKKDLEGRAAFGAWHRYRAMRDQVVDFRKKITRERCGEFGMFVLSPRADELKTELDAIDEEARRTLASKGIGGERELHRKLDPIDRRFRRLINDESILCRDQKLACVSPGVLLSDETRAFAPSRTRAAPVASLQPVPDQPASDFVGLTRNDGIAFGTWDRRPRVACLQERLKEHGAPLEADGMFGKQTAAAVHQMQARIGVPEQDSVDPATAEALEATPSPGEAPTISRLEGLAHGDGITFGTWGRRPQVTELQGRLTGLGFSCTVDGMFGDETLTALNRFQASRLLAETTTIDRPTADALEDLSGPAPECLPGQVPVAVESG